MQRTKKGTWLLNDAEMLLYFIYAREAISKSFTGDGAKALRSEAQAKADFIGKTLKEAGTFPVNFDR